MRFLLDTHTLLWWLHASPRLAKSAQALIVNPAHTILVSSVSVWEISIKKSRGKLRIPDYYLEKVAESNFLPLPISFGHAAAVQNLPFHHKDPFDRLLIAQAQVEGLTIVTRDSLIKRYNVPVIF